MKNIVKNRILFCFLFGFVQIVQSSDFMSKAWQAVTVSNIATPVIGFLAADTLYRSVRLQYCLKDSKSNLSLTLPIASSFTSLASLYASAYAKPSVKNLPWLALAGIVGIVARFLHENEVLYVQRDLHNLVKNNDRERVKRLINYGYSSKSLNDILLMKAIVSQSQDVIDYLLETDVNLDYRYSNETTFLIEAVLQGNLAVVEKLIKKDVNLNAVDGDNGTALIYATMHSSRYPIAKKLIAAGANVQMVNNKGETAARLFIFNRTSDQELLYVLKNAGVGEDVDGVDQNGNTLLMHAVSDNDKLQVQMLIELGADPAKTNNQGQTALQLAHNYVANKQAVHHYMPVYQVTEKERVDNDDIQYLLAEAERQW